MTLVMNLGAADDLQAKGLDAVRACQRAGRVPLKWIMGRETFSRWRALKGRPDFAMFVSLPIVVNPCAPPTLLELDEF